MMLRSYVGMKGTWCRCYDGWNYGLTDWSIGNKVNLMTPSWRISFFVLKMREIERMSQWRANKMDPKDIMKIL